MLIVSPLFAQNSEVAGSVTDPSKAAVSGADVTLVQTETGGRRGAISSPEGYYTFPLLLPGTYELTVIKGGFQKQSRTGITVETGQISTVDVELAVGLVTETVNVTESCFGGRSRQQRQLLDRRRHGTESHAGRADSGV